MRTLAAFVSIACALVLRCQSGEDVAGATSETTNGGVALVGGRPAEGASVKLIRADMSVLDSAGPAIVDSTAVDSLGVFRFDAISAGHNLQIDHPYGAALIATDNMASGDTIRLLQQGRYAGMALQGAASAHSAYLWGTAYHCAPDSNGRFDFGAIAPGTYPVLFQTSGSPSGYAFNTILRIGENEAKYDSSANADPDRLPLDRFDAGFGLTALGYFVDDIVWYYFTDSLTRYYDDATGQWAFQHVAPGERGNSILVPSVIPDGNVGSLLSVTAVLGDGIAYPYAGLGVLLAEAGHNQRMDLSAMSAFSLRARGQGTVRIRFESAVLDSIDRGRQYTYLYTLTDSWRSLSIHPDSLALVPYDAAIAASVPWSAAATAIDRIEFEFVSSDNTIGDTLSFDFDDLVFESVRLEDIIDRSP